MTIDRGWWQSLAHARLKDMTPGDLSYLVWGPLRLYSLNTNSAGGTFEPHHHEDVEIVTIILEGVFEHRDGASGIGRQPAGCDWVRNPTNLARLRVSVGFTGFRRKRRKVSVKFTVSPASTRSINYNPLKLTN